VVSPAPSPPTSQPGPEGLPASGGQPTGESKSLPPDAGSGCNPGSSPGSTWNGGWLLLGLLSPGLAFRWLRNWIIGQGHHTGDKLRFALRQRVFSCPHRRDE
jgi:hypothetical protein